EAHGISITMPAAKDRTYAIYLELIRGRLPPLHGAVVFIRRARAAGLRLAVASAADRVKVEGNLAEIGVPASEFAAVITGSEVARKKPHPEGFLAAAAAMGVPGEQCLVVEDAINGCSAGVAAGATVLGLTTSFDAAALCEAGAQYTAPDLAAVPAALEQKLGMA
ncbi:MAG: HAD family hydrolase, partial [Planctomycetota bacterium]